MAWHTSTAMPTCGFTLYVAVVAPRRPISSATVLTLVTAARSSRPCSSRSASTTTNTPTLSSIAGDAASPFRRGR